VSLILIVEDNASLALGLQRSLEAAGFEVEVARDAKGAAAAWAGSDPILVVLDLMLPDASGLEVLRDQRAAGSKTPVLILSARSEEVDKLQGFRLGADDYVVKPVGVLELIARVEAILRRVRPSATTISAPRREHPVRFGDVTVDPQRRSVEKRDAPVELAPLEFDLLLCLLRGNGAVVDRATLLTEVWGYKRPVATRTVDTHVANLRAKLEDDPARPRHILTVRKMGYRLKR
jgi:two-component system, OmpR family, alkaline phosphatase synthesis response regulator PhoP